MKNRTIVFDDTKNRTIFLKKPFTTLLRYDIIEKICLRELFFSYKNNAPTLKNPLPKTTFASAVSFTRILSIAMELSFETTICRLKAFSSSEKNSFKVFLLLSAL